jgi:hypothetical protein
MQHSSFPTTSISHRLISFYVGPSPIVETAWKYYELFRLAGEALAFVALIIGLVGYFVIDANQRRKARSQAMILGGTAALVCLLLLNSIYTAISWIVAGTTANSDPLSVFMPYAVRNWDLVQPGGGSIYPVVATVAPACGILGLSGIAIGSGMWAIGNRGGTTHRYGRQALYFGIGALTISVGGRLYSAIVYVLAPGF